MEVLKNNGPIKVREEAWCKHNGEEIKFPFVRTMSTYCMPMPPYSRREDDVIGTGKHCYNQLRVLNLSFLLKWPNPQLSGQMSQHIQN